MFDVANGMFEIYQCWCGKGTLKFKVQSLEGCHVCCCTVEPSVSTPLISLLSVQAALQSVTTHEIKPSKSTVGAS